MFDDEKTDDLAQYGVWVKSGPQDVLDENEETASPLPKLEDILESQEALVSTQDEPVSQEISLEDEEPVINPIESVYDDPFADDTPVSQNEITLSSTDDDSAFDIPQEQETTISQSDIEDDPFSQKDSSIDTTSTVVDSNFEESFAQEESAQEATTADNYNWIGTETEEKDTSAQMFLEDEIPDFTESFTTTDSAQTDSFATEEPISTEETDTTTSLAFSDNIKDSEALTNDTIIEETALPDFSDFVADSDESLDATKEENPEPTFETDDIALGVAGIAGGIAIGTALASDKEETMQEFNASDIPDGEVSLDEFNISDIPDGEVSMDDFFGGGGGDSVDFNEISLDDFMSGSEGFVSENDESVIFDQSEPLNIELEFDDEFLEESAKLKSSHLEINDASQFFDSDFGVEIIDESPGSSSSSSFGGGDDFDVSSIEGFDFDSIPDMADSSPKAEAMSEEFAVADSVSPEESFEPKADIPQNTEVIDFTTEEFTVSEEKEAPKASSTTSDLGEDITSEFDDILSDLGPSVIQDKDEKKSTVRIINLTVSEEDEDFEEMDTGIDETDAEEEIVVSLHLENIEHGEKRSAIPKDTHAPESFDISEIEGFDCLDDITTTEGDDGFSPVPFQDEVTTEVSDFSIKEEAPTQTEALADTDVFTETSDETEETVTQTDTEPVIQNDIEETQQEPEENTMDFDDIKAVENDITESQDDTFISDKELSEMDIADQSFDENFDPFNVSTSEPTDVPLSDIDFSEQTTPEQGIPNEEDIDLSSDELSLEDPIFEETTTQEDMPMEETPTDTDFSNDDFPQTESSQEDVVFDDVPVTTEAAINEESTTEETFINNEDVRDTVVQDTVNQDNIADDIGDSFATNEIATDNKESIEDNSEDAPAVEDTFAEGEVVTEPQVKETATQESDSEKILSLLKSELSSIKSELSSLKSELDILKSEKAPVISATENTDEATQEAPAEEVPQEPTTDDISEQIGFQDGQEETDNFDDTEIDPSGGEETYDDLSILDKEQDSVEKSSGFFGDDDTDESIALTGDELNNILITADFSAEEEAATESTNDTEVEATSQPNNAEETPTIDTSFAEESTTIDKEEPLDSLSEDEEFENETLDIPVDENASTETTDEIANEDSIEETVLSNTEENEIIEETELPDVEAVPLTTITESVDYLSNDLPDTDIDETEIAPADFENEVLEEPNIDNFDLSFSEPQNNDEETETEIQLQDDSTSTEESDEMEISDPFEFAEEDTTDETQDTVETEEATLTEEIPSVEDAMANLNLDEGLEMQDTFQVPEMETEEHATTEGENLTDSEIFNSLETSVMPQSEPVAHSMLKEAEADNNSESAEAIPDNLKSDIKSVLSYMDQLLDNLPEDKIEEFAKSEHFQIYKKLFDELGIS